MIRRGVQDGEWVSAEGETIWEATKQTRRGEKEAQATPSSRQHKESRRLDTGLDEDEKSGNSKSISAATDQEEGLGADPGSNGETSSSSIEAEPAEPETSSRAREIEETEGTAVQSSAVALGAEQEPAPELDLSRTKRFYGVAAGTGGWLFGLVIAAVSPPALGGFALLISWPLLPIAMFLDTRKTGFFSAATGISIGYIILSATGFLGPIPDVVYLYRRENSWGT